MFNLFGLVFVLLLLVPNLVFAFTHKDSLISITTKPSSSSSRSVGSAAFSLNSSRSLLCRGFFFDGGRTVYLAVGATLVALYLLGWVVFWKESSLRKAIALSTLPSLLFLESGILTLNLPLIAFALLFAPCHITISVKNALAERSMPKR